MTAHDIIAGSRPITINFTSHIRSPSAQATKCESSQWSNGGNAHSVALTKCSGKSTRGWTLVYWIEATKGDI